MRPALKFESRTFSALYNQHQMAVFSTTRYDPHYSKTRHTHENFFGRHCILVHTPETRISNSPPGETESACR